MWTNDVAIKTPAPKQSKIDSNKGLFLRFLFGNAAGSNPTNILPKPKEIITIILAQFLFIFYRLLFTLFLYCFKLTKSKLAFVMLKRSLNY